MGKSRNSDDNFLVQGSILAAASIISRMIGLFYRIPLKSIIGDQGNDYYGVAMDIYSILLLISSYSLPLAVSKLVSIRIARGQRKNAYRVFKGALIFALCSGGIAGLVVYFGADFITSTVMKTPLSVFALQVLAPTMVIVAVLGVIRGFFQGLGTMMPSAFSQLIEQIVNAGVSIWIAYVLYSRGVKIGSVLGNPEKYGASFGAAGGTIGTGAGAAVALLFTLFVYLTFLPVFKRQLKRDKSKKTESYGTIFKILIMTIIPVLLSTTIYNISTTVDTGLFKQIVTAQGYAEKEISVMWGIFTGEYKVLVNVPIAIASSLAASSVPSIANAFQVENKSILKEKITSSIRFVMVIAFPCAVGMGVLASPILTLLFTDSRNEPARMLQVGAISIIFYSLSTVSNAILQGINRMKVPVKNAVVALILHIVVLVALLYGLNLNIYAVVIANAFFSFVMCILNAIAIRKYAHYHQEIKKTFVVPALSSAIMGVFVYVIYALIKQLLKSNAVATIVSIFLGTIVYGVFVLLLKGLNEEDLLDFPKGRLLVRIGKRLHLLR